MVTDVPGTPSTGVNTNASNSLVPCGRPEQGVDARRNRHQAGARQPAPSASLPVPNSVIVSGFERRRWRRRSSRSKMASRRFQIRCLVGLGPGDRRRDAPTAPAGLDGDRDLARRRITVLVNDRVGDRVRPVRGGRVGDFVVGAKRGVAVSRVDFGQRLVVAGEAGAISPLMSAVRETIWLGATVIALSPAVGPGSTVTATSPDAVSLYSSVTM